MPLACTRPLTMETGWFLLHQIQHALSLYDNGTHGRCFWVVSRLISRCWAWSYWYFLFCSLGFLCFSPLHFPSMHPAPESQSSDTSDHLQLYLISISSMYSFMCSLVACLSQFESKNKDAQTPTKAHRRGAMNQPDGKVKCNGGIRVIVCLPKPSTGECLHHSCSGSFTRGWTL